MSASPTNATSGFISEATSALASDAAPALPSAPEPPRSGREALQALLAFSSLHEQIRQRRSREAQAITNQAAADDQELEQFALDEVLQMVAERALAITGADGVAIALAEGDHIVCRGSAGNIAPDRGARLELNSSFSGACFRTGQIVRCDDAETDARVNVQACRRLGTHSMVAVPLCGRHSVIGLLEAFSTDAYGFNDSDVRSLNLLAELILAAIKPEEEVQLERVSQQAVAEAESPEPIQETTPESRAASGESPIATEVEPKPIPECTPAILTLAHDRAKASRPGLAVVLAVVALAALCGAGLWWTIHERTQGPVAAKRAEPSAAAAPQTENAKPTVALPQMKAIDMRSPAALEQKLAVLPKVTGIRHWSSAGSSTVVIDLQDQVQYEAHRIPSPDRIYFDLHDTALSPALVGTNIEVGDALLVRIRIAQPMPGVTRVVLDTAGASNFSVSLESNPYRLVAEVRAPGAAVSPARTQIDLFPAPAPSQGAKLSAPAHPAGAEEGQLRAQAPRLRIAVDAGHGGWDLGTAGRQGLLEKDLVLDVAERLGNLLSERLGAEVIYTRQNDTYIPLEDRAGMANQAQADLFVSVHANYSDDRSARGVETYFSNTFSSVNARSRSSSAGSLQNINWANVDIREKVLESRRFAASVQRSLYGWLAGKNPGIRDRGVKEAQYVVLTGTTMPAILAEVSFVSSPSDESKLQSAVYRQQIAYALYKGIAGYVATSHRVKMASTSAKPTGK
jgi:N-acetylmuramoyl-L-alanine amidase/putative methionine-R-sulfoxide reductase with GAF domain